MSKAGTDIWSEVTTSGDAPTARNGHSAVSWIDSITNDPKMTVFGGIGGARKNDVHILNLVTGAWSEVTTSGDAPDARQLHTAVTWVDPSTNEPKMSVFGGYDGDGAWKNDVHILNLVTGAWSEVTTSGDAPTEGNGHSAVSWIDSITNEPKMTVFGGTDGAWKNDVHILNLVTREWSEVTTSGTPPSARFRHSAVSWIDPSTHSINMTVFGGYDGAMKNDVYTLLLMTMPSIRRPKGVVLCGKC